MWGIGCTYSTNPVSFQQLAQIFKLLGFKTSTFIAFLLLKFLTWRSLELILTNLQRRYKKYVTASDLHLIFPITYGKNCSFTSRIQTLSSDLY
jgi:hypothetical protein